MTSRRAAPRRGEEICAALACSAPVTAAMILKSEAAEMTEVRHFFLSWSILGASCSWYDSVFEETHA